MVAWLTLTPFGTKAHAAGGGSTSASPSRETTAEQSQKQKPPQEMEVEKTRKDTSLSAPALIAALVAIAAGILAVSASSDNR